MVIMQPQNWSGVSAAPIRPAFSPVHASLLLLLLRARKAVQTAGARKTVHATSKTPPPPTIHGRGCPTGADSGALDRSTTPNHVAIAWGKGEVDRCGDRRAEGAWIAGVSWPMHLAHPSSSSWIASSSSRERRRSFMRPLGSPRASAAAGTHQLFLLSAIEAHPFQPFPFDWDRCAFGTLPARGRPFFLGGSIDRRRGRARLMP